jgi:hypothetical protein
MNNLMNNLSYIEMLDIIASGDSLEKVHLCGSYQTLPADIIEALAQDEDWGVRYWLIRRRDSIGGRLLPAKVVAALARDKEATVRYCLATWGVSVPKDVLCTLADDEEADVRASASDRLGNKPPWM